MIRLAVGTTRMNLCKNCKHSRPCRVPFWTIGTLVCSLKSGSAKIDPVYGWLEYESPEEVVQCLTERKEGGCGPEGVNYEEKTT